MDWSLFKPDKSKNSLQILLRISYKAEMGSAIDDHVKNGKKIIT